MNVESNQNNRNKHKQCSLGFNDIDSIAHQDIKEESIDKDHEEDADKDASGILDLIVNNEGFPIKLAMSPSFKKCAEKKDIIKTAQFWCRRTFQCIMFYEG